MKGDRSGNLDISGYNKTPVKKAWFFSLCQNFGKFGQDINGTFWSRWRFLGIETASRPLARVIHRAYKPVSMRDRAE